MTSPAAAAMQELAAVNLRSRSATAEALPRARQAAGLIRAALEQGENPFRELDSRTVLRASSFAVRLCESALVNGAPDDLYLALWLVAGMDPAGEMMHDLYFTAAIFQSTRLRLGLGHADIAAQAEQIPFAPAREFLVKFFARDSDADQILGAYAITLVDDDKGLHFRQQL